MIGFLLKKNFFDMWDNLFKVIIINLGFIASASIVTIPAMIPSLFELAPALGFAIMLLGVLWCCVYLSASALSLKAVSDYGNFGIRDFFGNLKKAWLHGLLFGFIVILVAALFIFVIPFYLSMQSLPGILFAAIIFWTVLISIFALQFFFAVRARLDTKPKKIIKKCFIIFFDNPLFCIFSSIYNLIWLILSMFVAFLFPGPAGLLLFLDEALRLRLLKYDWLEQNPDANRKKIPWDALLIEERERTGTRSLKSFIFPWKD